MGDAQEFNVELRAHREFFLTLGYGPSEYVLRAGFAVAVCGYGPYCDGVAGALS